MLNIKFIQKLLLLFIVASSLVSCSRQKITKVKVPPIKILSAMGYGTADIYKNYSPEQRRLMSMRASKMDALRNLAEQIYGVRIHGHTTVSDMVVRNDSYRSYIDAFLKGAHVKSITALNNNTYESVVEITLTPKFFTCFSGEASAYSQCFSRRQKYSENKHSDLKLAGVSNNYSCNSANCYQYPSISGFDNKTN
ncbi:MAG: LPP20 family lipoprotein [Methyloprofundus sp.]|nr:LPP20 family lipoprotein [Methyloprofundus sp.]